MREISRLSGVYLENFQSLKEPVFFRMNKLCFFYGPNSSGKSAIHDALYLINETITNKHDWNFTNLYQKFGANFSTKIGLEFISGDFNFDEDQRIWRDTPDRFDEYEHTDFFQDIKNKKIQIEVSNFGDELKVAIDGQPLFEILNEYTYFNEEFEKLNIEEIEKRDIDPYDISDFQIKGKLVIYKNVMKKYHSICCFSVTDFFETSKEDTSIFKNIFHEDYQDKQIINGISISIGSKEITSIDFNCYEMINGDLLENEIFDKSVENFHMSSENRVKSINNFKVNNNRILHKLEKLSTDYKIIIKGFIFQIKNALNYAHIKGDRQILNSTHCISYTTNSVGTYINLLEEKRDDLDPLKMYADEITNNKFVFSPENKPKFQGDFINYCLNKHLPSLKGYQVLPKIFIVNEQGVNSKEINNKLIYLFIKNKNNKELGFQDVGSGISFIMPILASIWCKRISFIEQPELHLHPKAQCEIADAFICATYYGNHSIIETHSEHLLLRVSRRIRETTKKYLLADELKIQSKDVNIYYFDPQPDGSTRVKNIRMDSHGELMDLWPGGFFAERDEELFS